MSREAERTPHGRYVVDGRRRRTADPSVPDDVRARQGRLIRRAART
jgi:hypothetical protein